MATGTNQEDALKQEFGNGGVGIEQEDSEQDMGSEVDEYSEHNEPFASLYDHDEDDEDDEAEDEYGSESSHNEARQRPVDESMREDEPSFPTTNQSLKADLKVSAATAPGEKPDSLRPSRHKLANHITISEDRSIGSEFDLDDRVLVALRPREIKHTQVLPADQHNGPEPPRMNAQQQQHIMQQRRQLQVERQAMMAQQGMPQQGMPMGMNPNAKAQMTLAQYKAMRRGQNLMGVARPVNLPQHLQQTQQAQHPKPPYVTSSFQPYIPDSLENDRSGRSRINSAPKGEQGHKVESSGGSSRQSLGALEAVRVVPCPQQEQSVKVGGDSRPHNDIEPGQPWGTTLPWPSTGAPDRAKIDNGKGAARNFSQMNASVLGVPEEAATDLEALQAYITDLREKAKMLEDLKSQRVPSTFQIIHRINRERGPSMYIDPPQWSTGENNTQILTSSLPILNLSSYLDKHPMLAFIVFREYEGKPLDNRHNDMPQVKHTSESLEVVTVDLTNAISNFLESNQRFSDVFEDFSWSQNHSLSSPYLAIYHSRKILDAYMEDMPNHQRLQFQVLLDYVLSEYREKYATADSLMERGKITPAYIEYLFKPGDILVEGSNQDVRGVVCKSWLLSSSPPAWRNKPARKAKET
ncbi:hypothetical protein B0J14DRAFT_650301 [Halenospora varia]|nr:hypothetical protein B0J14DRAFT_650301 [Halenospora varia]